MENNYLVVCHLEPKHWWKRSRWELVEPLRVMYFIVPKGFITDGASVPLMFQWLFSPTGKYMKAAVLHDYLLTKFGARYADARFLEAMINLGISKYRARTMFIAVRVWHLLTSKN